MEVKLYVGNLAFSTTEEEIKALFAQAGTVTDAALIKDRDTGSSKGFAFVTMSSQQEADNAIKMFNGYTLANRELKVNPARPREESGFGNRGGGGYGNRGGGYGNRGGGDRDRRGGSGGRRY